MTILLSLLTHFNFLSVLSHYIATYDTHSFLLLCPNFHVFSAFIAAGEKFETDENILATIFYDLITTVWPTYDPSIAGVLLGNNSKRDGSILIFLD